MSPDVSLLGRQRKMMAGLVPGYDFMSSWVVVSPAVSGYCAL